MESEFVGDLMHHAEEVLALYSISEPAIEFIRHNENMTFKVTDTSDDKQYLLRIHKPATAGLFGIQHTLEGLKSEMYLLQGLSQKNSLRVQKPSVNREGQFVSEYTANEFGSCYATLLEWIEGSTLTLQEDNIGQIVFALGEKLADLHHFSRESALPALTRPVYDAARIDSAIEELKYGIEASLYSQEHYEIIREVLEYVKGQLRDLDAQQEWGLIHADVQLGNVIITNEGPCYIDFGLFGYGYYLFDLGSASSILPSELRQTLLLGYASRSTFTFDQVRYIEGLIFMDIFISYLFFIHDFDRNGWIKEDAAKVCDTLCRDFLAGKEVYYSF
ncbi:phosphotransferase enzyme family protein [Paenibacillus sp. FSL M7-1046]|uniref:phosphotransferase enzyme family protein n=1 Tax=Paenibacillus sp. FSL M7-1046 TaxID=2975315 RepID=UPI0030F8DE5B